MSLQYGQTAAPLTCVLELPYGMTRRQHQEQTSDTVMATAQVCQIASAETHSESFLDYALCAVMHLHVQLIGFVAE